MTALRRLSPAGTMAGCGLVIILLLTSAAILADKLASYLPDNRFPAFLPPSAQHLLGTDDVGHDIFSQLIFAGRISLLTGFAAAVSAVSIGVAAGLAAGYFSGLKGQFAAGVIDIVLLIPTLPLMVMLTAYLGQDLWNIVAVIGLLGWCSTARVVQARTMQLREMPFVKALKAIGLSDRRIIFRHMLPNTAGVIAAKFILSVAQAMLSEAALSFLGLGDPMHISWGGMMHYAFHRGGFVNDLWYWYLPPGICIALTVVGLALCGFYLEDNKK